MCGIVGFIGNKPAKQFLLTGLKRMEYRGYDSAGIAVIDGQNLELTRIKGKVDQLRHKARSKSKAGQIGIGHTRWATHGKPAVQNAHPHVAIRVAVVHNGIVENHAALREELSGKGVHFHSETDSEVLAWLIEEEYQKCGLLDRAVVAALRRVRGAYGIAAMVSDNPDVLVAAKRSSPLAVGNSAGCTYVASDASALAGFVSDVSYLEDDQIAICTPQGVTIKSLNGKLQNIARVPIITSVESLQKNGHDHFLIKEILEQPESARAVLRGRLEAGRSKVQLGGLNLTPEQMRSCPQLVLVGCGTAYYAGLYAKNLLEKLTDIPVSVEVASELRYREPAIAKGAIAIAISQSGETADTLAAVLELQSKNIPTLGVINVVGSTIARTVDGGVYLHAGPEISVASTKAFTTQVLALLLFGLEFAAQRKTSRSQSRQLKDALLKLPEEIATALELRLLIARRAHNWSGYSHAFFLGRGSLHPIALEGSHKLKEVSYIHAEAYPAGEMKHGANALLDETLLTVFLLGKGRLYEKSLSNLAEVEARASRILVVTDDEEYAKKHEDALYVATSSEWTAPLVMNVVLQLIAYYVAKERKCEIDQPRNLAKSVTVE